MFVFRAPAEKRTDARHWEGELHYEGEIACRRATSNVGLPAGSTRHKHSRDRAYSVCRKHGYGETEGQLPAGAASLHEANWNHGEIYCVYDGQNYFGRPTLSQAHCAQVLLQQSIADAIESNAAIQTIRTAAFPPLENTKNNGYLAFLAFLDFFTFVGAALSGPG